MEHSHTALLCDLCKRVERKGLQSGLIYIFASLVLYHNYLNVLSFDTSSHSLCDIPTFLYAKQCVDRVNDLWFIF